MNALRNLGQTNVMFAKSTTKLSTGLRIANAGDDPSGLIMSEGLRAQISGNGQAIRNSQDALNYTRTAEGALDEISKLVREARVLAVASANTGTLSASQLRANQDQLSLIVDSIDRIAQNTQFGQKKLLDGSAGISAVVVDGANIKSVFMGGTVGGQPITDDASVDVQVTTAATRAEHTGTRTVATANLAAYQATAVGNAGSFSINGRTFNVDTTDTWADVVKMINEEAGATNVTAEAVHDGTNGQIVLRSQDYGSNHKVRLVDASGIIQNASGSVTVSGVDAVAQVTVGTLNPVTFSGGSFDTDGLTLMDSDGNRITLTEAGNQVTTHASAAQVTAGQVQFQIGANAGMTQTLSIGAFTSSALNVSGMDITTSTGATDALTTIDEAIEELNRRRGELGSFMRNVLETNIRSLGVAQENLSATESSIRDIDVAEEMTHYTKLQILQQSGLSVLAQANAAPQAVLSLLQ